MQFTLESNSAVNLVTAYGDGAIHLRERIVRAGVIITPTHIIEDWGVSSVAALDLQALAPLFELEPDLIVLGTGARLQFPAARLRARIQARGIGLEVMDNAAACRTYNVLVLEGRKVVAALLP